MAKPWNDRQLDALSHKVGELERRMDLRFDQVNEKFVQVNERFDRLETDLRAFQRSALQLSGVVIAALIGFIATAQIF